MWPVQRLQMTPLLAIIVFAPVFAHVKAGWRLVCLSGVSYVTSECYLLVHVMCQSAAVLHMHQLRDELFDVDSSLHEPSAAKTSVLKEHVFPNIIDDSGLCPFLCR